MTERTDTKPESRDAKIARGMERMERWFSSHRIGILLHGERKVRLALALADSRFDDTQAHSDLQGLRNALAELHTPQLTTLAMLLDALYDVDRD